MTVILRNSDDENDFSSMDKAKMEVIRNTYCKGCTNDEIDLFSYVCKRTGLDPTQGQIYPVKRPERQKDGTYKEVMTIQTGVAGLRLIAERTGRYCPGREPTFTYDKNGNLFSATSYIKKQTKDGTWHEISRTAIWKEYVQTTKEGRPTKFWDKMPHGQLAKCAETLALKVGFPAELSGLLSDDEMGQADNPINTNLIQSTDNSRKIQPLIHEKMINNETVQQKIEKCITQEQAFELEDIICECHPDYQQKIADYLKSQSYDKIVQLPASAFEALRERAITRRDEYKASLKKEVKEDLFEVEVK